MARSPGGSREAQTVLTRRPFYRPFGLSEDTSPHPIKDTRGQPKEQYTPSQNTPHKFTLPYREHQSQRSRRPRIRV